MFLVIGFYGSRQRKIRAAYYMFFLYTLLGSLFMLVGVVYIYLSVGSTSYEALSVKMRGSTIGEGGDTTISSPGRSPKQPLPGMRLYDPLQGRQACPEFIACDQRVGQICPR